MYRLRFNIGLMRWPGMQACILGLLPVAGLLLLSTAALARMADAPAFVAPADEPIPDGSRVDVVADRLTYDQKTDVATATGTVQLTYGPYVLTASEVVYDMRNGKFRANGSIVLREPNGNALEATSAEIEENFKQGFARHVRALLTHNVTITAQYARRFENGVTIYEKASYSACKDCVSAGGTPAWQIVAREAKHDLNTRTIHYRDARLEFGGVPVFWTPYFAYPDPTVTRRTGWLIPSFSTGTYGFGVTTPYFWEIAPNKDLTFSPMWMTKQGVMGDVEWRHRLSSGMYSARAFGLHELAEEVSTSTSGPLRGAARTDGGFRINDTWDWGWDATVTSDRTFLSEYDIDYRNMLPSFVHATALSDRNYTKAQIIGWHTLVEAEDQAQIPVALPFVTGEYMLTPEIMGGELSLRFNAYSLARQDPVDDPSLGLDLGTYQSHAAAYAEWRRQMVSRSGLLLTPFAQFRSDLFYSENVPGGGSAEDPDIYLTPSAGFDMRMPFAASHGALQSVLTPVFQMIAAPSEQRNDDNANEDAITLNFDTTNLFLSDRFTGFDRREGGVRANAGVSYSILGQNGAFLRASLGESFHLAGENSFTVGSGLDGTASDLVGAVAMQINENVTLGYQARVEEDLSRINAQEATAALSFWRISGSVSYADITAAPDYGRPEDMRQVWANAYYDIDGTWSVFGNLRYDWDDEKFMTQSLGIAFDCDCMRAALTYSMSNSGAFGVAEEGTEQRIDLSIALRTIGAVTGSFKVP